MHQNVAFGLVSCPETIDSISLPQSLKVWPPVVDPTSNIASAIEALKWGDRLRFEDAPFQNLFLRVRVKKRLLSKGRHAPPLTRKRPSTLRPAVKWYVDILDVTF